MNTAIIIALIGLIGSVFQGIPAYKVFFKKNEGADGLLETTKSKNTKPRLHSKKYKKVTLFLLIFFVILAITGLCFVKFYSDKPNISVSYPQEHERVNDPVEIKGTYSNIDTTKQVIWVAVYSENYQLHFIKDKPASFSGNKDWSDNEAIIGARGDQFVLKVMLIDIKSKAYNEIYQYVHGIGSGGMRVLPEGCQILDKITIYKN